MPFDIDLNRNEFCVGIVKNTPTEFQLKVGRTKELCDSSNTLSFQKQKPLMTKCHYISMGIFENQIIDCLRQHDWQNFGIANQPDDVLYYINHRFMYNAPKLPLTRL
jgi:hypothetical protein